MSKKRTFFLKGFITLESDKKYGLSIISNIDKESHTPTNKTNIYDVIDKNEEVPISFYDEKNDKCMITMIDWLNQDKFPTKTDKSCFWCRHSFTTNPLGCPIKYINNRIEKSYISHITKDKYYMKENITKTKLLNTLNIKLEGYDIKQCEKEYYLTDGIFCSFNCIVAFVNDNSHNNFYNESKMLLNIMYNEINDKKPTKIKPAPHWRLLKDYGGTLTIDEFRSTFNIHEYEECSFHMKTLSKIFKEK